MENIYQGQQNKDIFFKIKMRWWSDILSSSVMLIQIDKLVQERHNSIANAPELRICRTNLSRYSLDQATVINAHLCFI